MQIDEENDVSTPCCCADTECVFRAMQTNTAQSKTLWLLHLRSLLSELIVNFSKSYSSSPPLPVCLSLWVYDVN